MFKISSIPGFIYLITILFLSNLICVSDLRGEDYSRLLDKAAKLKLYEHQYWHTLLHYKKKFGQYKSEINDSSFFVSSEGFLSPEKELKAVINEFFVLKNSEIISRFPARYRWLCLQLDIQYDVNIFKEQYKLYNKAVQKIDSLSLIFATDYSGSPESIFGHTLIRLDSKEGAGLVGMSLNHSAFTGDASSVEYLIKGLGGGFPGKYSSEKYYKRVSLYNYKESRDLFEYTLTLNHPEIQYMMDHLFELDRVSLPYYFFTSNCAYNILYLIDAAYQKKRLIPELKPWVIPVETVKVLHAENLIKSSHYRPSIGGRLAYHSRKLNTVQQKMAKDFAEGTITSDDILNKRFLSREEKARIFDLSLEYYHFKVFRDTTSDDDWKNITRQSIQMSRPRSKLGFIPYETIKRQDPVSGHDSFLFESGAGYAFNNSYGFIKVRPSYHEFTDNHYGYLYGGEIVFPAVTAAWLGDGDKQLSENLYLEDFTLVRVTSLKQQSYMYQPLSWQFDVGGGKDLPLYDVYEGRIEYLLGFSRELSSYLFYYILAGGRLRYGGFVNISPVVKAGLLGHITDKATINTVCAYRKELLYEFSGLLDLNAEINYSFSQNTAVSASSHLYIINESASGKLTGSVKIYF